MSHMQQLVDNQEAIVGKTQTALLSMMETGKPVTDDAVSGIVRLSQALQVQVDKLMTLKTHG